MCAQSKRHKEHEEEGEEKTKTDKTNQLGNEDRILSCLTQIAPRKLHFIFETELPSIGNWIVPVAKSCTEFNNGKPQTPAQRIEGIPSHGSKCINQAPVFQKWWKSEPVEPHIQEMLE